MLIELGLLRLTVPVGKFLQGEPFLRYRAKGEGLLFAGSCPRRAPLQRRGFPLAQQRPGMRALLAGLRDRYFWIYPNGVNALLASEAVLHVPQLRAARLDEQVHAVSI